MSNEPWATPDWHVSPYAYDPAALAMSAPPAEVTVIDCTLREGEQQAGIVLAPEAKRRLARMLDELGMPEIEVGMPAVSEEERKTIAAICSDGLDASTVVVCRAVQQDIDWASECGVDQVSISIPMGYLQLEHKLKWPVDRVIETAAELSRYARSLGLRVTVSPYDTTRSRPDDLARFLRTVAAEGHMDRVRLVDTAGAASPEAIRVLVGFMSQHITVPIEVHCHNDFGLATANTLAAVGAGASAVSTTLNGMGERAGGAATEEVAIALRMLYGIDTGLDLERLYAASRYLQDSASAPVHPHKPLFGDETFDQEAGSVVAGFLNEPLVALPFRPELIGRKSRIRLGKMSGREALRAKLDELGLALTDDALHPLLEVVKQRATEMGRALQDSEVEELVTADTAAAVTATRGEANDA